MKDKIYHSKTLDQHYRHFENGIIFEDKVHYTNDEIQEIKKSNIDVQMIHDAKLKFDGSIISKEEMKKLTEKYKEEQPEYLKAVNYASKLLKSGKKPYTAIHEASEKYNISSSYIGRELGKRKKS